MDIFIAFMGLGLFGSVGGLLLLSLFMGQRIPSSMSELVRNPRFIAGCVCTFLAALCACAML